MKAKRNRWIRPSGTPRIREEKEDPLKDVDTVRKGFTNKAWARKIAEEKAKLKKPRN